MAGLGAIARDNIYVQAAQTTRAVVAGRPSVGPNSISAVLAGEGLVAGDGIAPLLGFFTPPSRVPKKSF